MNALAVIMERQGDFVTAKKLLEESLALKRGLDDARAIGVALQNLAAVCYRMGDHSDAQIYAEEALRTVETIEDRTTRPMILDLLARLATLRGSYEAARRMLVESLTTLAEIDDRPNIANSLETFAYLYGAMDKSRVAAVLLGAVESLRESISAPISPTDKKAVDRTIARLHDQMGEASLGQARTTGRLLSLRAAVDLALSDHPDDM